MCTQMANQGQYIQQLRDSERHRASQRTHNYPDPFNYHHRSTYHDPYAESHPHYPSTSSSTSTYSSQSSTSDHNLSQLMDQFIALRLENSNLSSNLEDEKNKRRNAEINSVKDKDYIRRLENNIQTLQTTRVVMDPSTYKNMAANYIASKRYSSRTPGTHLNCQNGDLVCDKLNKTETITDWSDFQSSSCPTTPPGGSSPSMNHTGMNKTLPPIFCPSKNHQDICRTSSLDSSLITPPCLNSPSSMTYLSSTKSFNQNSIKEENTLLDETKTTMKTSPQVSTPLDPWQYQQLLHSLEELEKS